VFTVFRYSTPQELVEGTATPGYLVLAGMLVVVGLAATYGAFARRDLVER
jgi:ABC-2 type transport system permease protein